VDEKTFKSLAAHDVSDGFEVYVAAFPMDPTDPTHWRPYLVARESMAAQVLGAPGDAFAGDALPSDVELEPQDRHAGWLGFLGEAEVVRRLGESQRLDLFRPFPDLEMVEVLARNNVSGRFAGIQVKTGVPIGANGEVSIHVRKRTFVPESTTWIVGLAWLPDRGRFAAKCLVMRREGLPGHAANNVGLYVLNFNPENPEGTRLEGFLQPLVELGNLVEALATTR
jgi:hypothetical protein